MSAKVTVLLFLQDVYAVLLFTDQGGMQPYIFNVDKPGIQADRLCF